MSEGIAFLMIMIADYTNFESLRAWIFYDFTVAR
jgi:hypothetical protein